MTVRQKLTRWLPPAVVDAYRRWYSDRRYIEHLPADQMRKEGIYLAGDYDKWETAMLQSTGYDADEILERTKTAMLKVKNFEAVYQRDSVIFDEIEYFWPLLAGLMWVTAESNGRLNVLDFGGSLGSSYFQNRKFLGNLFECRWNVVEQPSHFEAGRLLFEDETLRFYDSIAACLEETKPNVILLSGVLQYLPNPYAVLNELSNIACDYLIIDRTPIWLGGRDRLCVQYIPEEIYSASYPSWIFSNEELFKTLGRKWEIYAQFESFDHLPSPVPTLWKGILARKSFDYYVENFSPGEK